MEARRTERLIFALVALTGALVLTRLTVAGPGFTDAFYHLNAANRLVMGQGLTDAYLWTYIGAPDSLPAPSHLYWMPLSSLLAAGGMALLNAPGDYSAAQLPFALLYAGIVYSGFWLGGRLGGSRRAAWVAGLVTLFSGYYVRWWGAVDTFAPFGLVGALCLIGAGVALAARDEQTVSRRRWALWSAVGALAGLAHLARADGPLLLIAAWAAILWPLWYDRAQQNRFRRYLLPLLLSGAAYLLVMLPWFARNMQAVGSPLPLGGSQSIWFTEYNDLFSYPADASPSVFFAEGLGALFRTRWQAFAGDSGLLSGNLGTFIAVEGLVLMTPLMLLALWRRRRDPFLRAFWLYALGLHLVMTLVFPYPGYRGGLFHSAAALVPWWAALGAAGADDFAGWWARRRRQPPPLARRFFGGMLLLTAALLTAAAALSNRVPAQTPPGRYAPLLAALPPNARVMINDPAQLYYFTGLGGVVLPNEAPAAIVQIARRYEVGYLLLEEVNGENAAAPAPLLAILEQTPDFLKPLPLDMPGTKLYAIEY